MSKGKKFLSKFGFITAFFAASGILLLVSYLSPFPAWAGGICGGGGRCVYAPDPVPCPPGQDCRLKCNQEASGVASWEVYTAPQSGCLLVSTEGQNFDSILWVYKGPEGRQAQEFSDVTRLACDEDCGANKTSKVIISAEKGVTYYIAVDDQSSGRATSATASKTFVNGVPKTKEVTTKKIETANRPVAEPGESSVRLAE